MPDRWFVYMRTTSNVCTAQPETSLPHLGVQHLGPFNSKAEAIAAMCADVDPTLSDLSRCWTVSPANACDQLSEEAREQ